MTNRTALWRASAVVWRCVPVAKNGHSFRYCDPYGVADDARQQVIGAGGGGGGSGATCDRELMNINLAMCRMVYPKQERFNKSSLEAFDPISPTQAPPN